MGLLVDGVWHDVWYDTDATEGRFVRTESQFRHWVTMDGRPGPSGEGGFRAEPGRYHLYVSLACPWAHRTLIYRQLKGLDSMITLSVVNAFMGSKGWTFEPGPGVIQDTVHGAQHLYEVYLAADADYSGRVTVPVLWDRQRHTIVSNESSEIIRMFNQAFNDVGATGPDYCPPSLLGEIDRINEPIYHSVNNGVYRAGFATNQSAYESAVTELFGTLDWLEDRLSTQRYLLGPTLTEADWRLFTTLMRFDPVYHGHFKCNLRRLVDYPNLWGYTRDLYQQPGVSDTVNMDHIKAHYYRSHQTINPHRIVPVGPATDFTYPHDRDRFTEFNAAGRRDG